MTKYSFKYKSTNRVNIILLLLLMIALIFFLWFKYNYKSRAPLSENDNREDNKELVSKVDEEDQYDKTPESQRQLLAKYISMIDVNDNSSLIKIYNSINSSDIKYNCHSLSHDIGHYAYKIFGFDKALLLDDIKKNRILLYSCFGGYMHGVIEEAEADDATIANNPGKLCKNIAEDIIDSCYHGIGHALMNKFKSDIKASIESCEHISNYFYAMRCAEGVWMDYFYGKGDGKYIVYDKDNITKECVDTKEFAKPACYMYAGMGYVITHNNDNELALYMCDKLEILNYSAFCFKGVGIMSSSRYKNDYSMSEEIVHKYWKMKKRAYYQGLYNYGLIYGVSIDTLRDSCNNFKHKEDKELCEEVNGV